MNLMKNTLLFLLSLFSAAAIAQSTCQTAKPFCAGGVSGETFPATTNVTGAQTGPNYGCLLSTPNPAWYYLQINQSGNLDILIQGTITVPPPGSPGQDVDFICWGPFSSLTGICDSLTANKIVDCSYSGSFTETLNIPNGITGQYYMVLITNFANVVQDIIFSQYAGTGNTNCGLLGSKSKICAGSSATVVATNSGSLTNPTYSINPGGLTNNTGTFIVSPLVSTNYTLFVTGMNNLQQLTTQTAVANVTVNPQPSAVPQVTNTTCTSTINAFNMNVAFTPSTAAPGYTINWGGNPPNGITGAQQQSLSAQQQSATINANTYNATITAAGGCTFATSFTVEPTPEPALIDLQPGGISHTLTCLEPVLTLTSMVATNNYTWANGQQAPFSGQFGVFTSTMLGTWTINAVNPLSTCTSTAAVSIFINTVAPTTTVTPNFQNITCSLTSITPVNVTANPTVNVFHQITSPQGATLTISNFSGNYIVPGPGIYLDCAVDAANGCSTCKQFTVMANQGYPTFSLQSPQNYTLGCNSKSVAIINIVGASATDTNQIPTGGPVSYTILAPGSNSATPGGTLGLSSTYSVTVPGTWTVVTKDNNTYCETRVPISILSNTFSPDISAVVPSQVLDCNTPTTTLKGVSTTQNINYSWSFPGTPGSVNSEFVDVGIRTANTTQTLVANYTLTIEDNSSTCKSTSIVPIYQNIFKPNVLISNGGTPSITCVTTSVTLTHQSYTGIPPTNTFFPAPRAVVGALWEGPTPQDPLALSTTYVGQYPGVYTLTARDLNNGCTNTGTIQIADNRVYPVIRTPAQRQVIDCGVQSTSLTMDVTNKTSSFSYTWTPPPGAETGDIYKMPLIVKWPGIYRLVVLNGISGCATSSQVTLYSGTLTTNFEASTEKGFAPLAVTFTNMTATSTSITALSAIWSFGNGTYSVLPSTTITPTQTYKQPGTYVVSLNAIKGECAGVSSKTIIVEVPSAIEVPNIFTPNGDKVNDEFFLKAANLQHISFTVVDRWGHVVYEIISHTGNILWDGKNQRGEDVADGVYFYKLSATGTDEQSFEKSGTITVVR